jgi:hypothetical protein
MDNVMHDVVRIAKRGNALYVTQTIRACERLPASTQLRNSYQDVKLWWVADRRANHCRKIGEAGIAALHPGVCRGGGHRRRCKGKAAVSRWDQWPGEAAHRSAVDVGAHLQPGQAAIEERGAAVASVTAFVPGDGHHRSARPGRPAGRCAIPRRARGAANDGALRPAEEAGHA